MLSNAYSKICFFDHHFSSFFLQTLTLTLNENLQQNIVIFHTFPTIPNMLKLICLLNGMCTLFEIYFKSKEKNFIQQYLILPIFTVFYWNKSCTLTRQALYLCHHLHPSTHIPSNFFEQPLPFKPSFPFFPSNPSFPSDPFFPFNPSLPSRPSRPSLHFRSLLRSFR